MEKSTLRMFLGDTAFVRIIDFFIAHQEFDYSLTDIAKHAGVAWSTLNLLWSRLERYGFVEHTRKIGRAKMYKLNRKSAVVQHLIQFDLELSKHAANEIAEVELKNIPLAS